MNIAMEQTEEYVNGQLKNKYGDAFIRGNNGKFFGAAKSLFIITLTVTLTFIFIFFLLILQFFTSVRPKVLLQKVRSSKCLQQTQPHFMSSAFFGYYAIFWTLTAFINVMNLGKC